MAQACWTSSKYSLQMLYAPELALRSCWADTDALFAGMRDWGQHPIHIRHPFCFYYGHVAAFARIKILPQAVKQLSVLPLAEHRFMEPKGQTSIPPCEFPAHPFLLSAAHSASARRW